MAKRTIALVLAVSLIALTIAFFRFQLHIVGDSAREGVLLWNSQEAYLFVAWGRSGYHLTCAEYLFSYVLANVGVPRTVDDNRFSTVVVRITPSAVERHVTEPYREHQGFLAYAPHGNTIYAYDGGALWKWSGKQFEAVGLQEQQRLAIDQKEFSKEDYSNVNGWSLRRSLKGWPPDFNIELQGKAVTILPKQKDSGKELSLEILLPNGTSQTILHGKGDFHLVSKLEYQRDFGTP